MSKFRWSLIAVVMLGLLPVLLSGQTLVVERVASGLDDPLFATFAPGDNNRLYIVQREGVIRVLNLTTGVLNATNFITVPQVSSGGERGTLGLAFHPDFQSNKLFYVCHTDTSGDDVRVVQFTATNPNIADPETAVRIWEIDQPQNTHNGGWIGFGQDGYLYVSTGDGGLSNDNGSGHTPGIGNSQDITDNLLGKILRIDVNGDDFPGGMNINYAIPPTNPFVGIDGDDEIFAYGMRNPWRCSFDRATGDLYIADVGQNTREEITVLPAGSPAGKNLGWRLREGVIETPGAVGGRRPNGAIDPIYDYEHGNGPFEGNSVTGGYVYRGPVAEIQGNYFFADYISNNIWSLEFDGSDPNSFNGSNFNNLTRWNVFSTNGGLVENVSSFGEDAAGNVYIVDLEGEVFRIIDGSFTPPPNVYGGNVQVNVQNGDLRMTGQNNTDQFVIVVPTGVAGQYELSSMGNGLTPGTTFNGQATLMVEGITDDIRIDLKSGQKVLVLSKTDQTQFAVPDDLRITTTGNSSAILILDSLDVGGKTFLRTKNGDDVVLTTGCSFNERVRINLGNGDDVFTDGDSLPASSCNGNLDVRTGGGFDFAACFGTMALGSAPMRMGSGDDGTALVGCMFGPTTIYGNGGSDRFAGEDNFFASLSLRQMENESESVSTILSQIESSPIYQEAVSILMLLGLQN